MKPSILALALLIGCTGEPKDSAEPADTGNDTNVYQVRWSGAFPLACVDLDEDAYGDPANLACPAGLTPDCDDTDPSVNPGMVEIPGNDKDDDCDPRTPRGCRSELE